MTDETYPTRTTASTRHVTNERPPFAMVPEALLFDATISDKAVRLYGVLLRHGDDPTDCYPSKRRLASLMGCAASSLMRPTIELENAGWIERVRRFDQYGAETSCGYVVRCEARTSGATPARESAPPTRATAEAPRAPERDEREPDEREPVNDTSRVSTLELVSDSSDDGADAWATFWKQYPRKLGKPKAERAFRRALGRARLDDVLEGLGRWVVYWQARNEPEFVPHPATWLNDDRWNDVPPAVKSKASPLGPGATGIAESWAGATPPIRRGQR